MKQIELQISLHKNKKYRIHVERSTFLALQSKTAAEKWLRKYKKLIQTDVKQINFFIPQVYNLYRQNYFQFDDRTQREISQYILNAEDRFNYIFKQFSDSNKNVFTFHNIEIVLSSIINATSTIYKYAQKSKNYPLLHLSDPLLALMLDFEKSHLKRKMSLKLDSSFNNIVELKKAN